MKRPVPRKHYLALIMKPRSFFLYPCLFSVLLAGVGALETCSALDEKDNPQEKGIPTDEMQLYEGFFDFYWDSKTAKLWLEIAEFEKPFLYVTSLASGLGSNPVGLDRGQLGSTRLVQFRRVGDRVYLEQLNHKYRASSRNPSEREAVRDSFARSILWSGVAKRGTAKDAPGPVVDLTSLVVRDAHRAVEKLSSTGQGSFRFEKERSFVHLPRTRAFPRNCEFEAVVTLSSNSPGSLVRRTVASGESVSLRQHHSFVMLPDDQYRPRKFDPRCGAFAVSHADYSVGIDQPLERRWITRHRLEKQDPDAERSLPVAPIIYYLDSGVPSPVREALLEGARWWNEAFEAAGFIDAFQVKMLPAGADPMDVRYNVIQWVHRATRGWSYGQSVVDPRTGEILKGHVLLGSLRVRQDFLLMQGLSGDLSRAQGSSSPKPSFGHDIGVGPPGNVCRQLGSAPFPLTRLFSREQSVEVALDRIRQLSAHEVGHTLGFAHNFAASTYGDRASVMDYPAPRTRITGERIALDDAYGVGIGEWDKFTVRYAYSQFKNGIEEEQGLKALVAKAIAEKMIYVSDADARPSGAAHPLGNLWDNGTDPVDGLRHEMKVRQLALKSFGEQLVDEGEPLAELEKSLVPIYLHHRYQVEAAAKKIGGVLYRYSVRGDRQPRPTAVAVPQQRMALEALLQALSPSELVVPAGIVNMIPPKPFTSPSDRERFPSRTTPVLDTEAIIEVGADLVLKNILQPQRLARVSALEQENWSAGRVIDSVADHVFVPRQEESAAQKRARRIVQGVFVNRLIRLAENRNAALDVSAQARQSLEELRKRLERAMVAVPARTIESAHYSHLGKRVASFLEIREPRSSNPGLSESPPGSPIGNR
ncbi:MAG: zinc-dependent metalloprotease [Planctomycetota bacterium]|nr:zinc-dependent metalloprotease [Planctomycetota bacterium]